MMNGLMGHVDMHVTGLGSHFHEEESILRSCESGSAEHLARETRQRETLQSRLNHEKQHVTTLQTELHQAKTQGNVSPKNLDTRVRVELERRQQAARTEEQ
eukprot:678509-Prorocentrum_lima.AAC.1